MKRFPLMLLAMVISFATMGQQAKITFVEQTHDFGEIKEADGPVTYEFKFKNEGQIPLQISNVRASCGCTTPAWSKEPILPGKEGFIKASYNPKGRPGSFHKSLTITSNADPNVQYLYIKGKVEPRPRTPKDDLPTQLGALRIKYRSFNMGKLTNQKEVTKTFDMMNDSEKTLTLKGATSPDHIEVSFSKNILAPQEKGKISITYDPAAKDDLGFLSDQVTITTDEAGADAKKSLRVVATVEEYFPPMTSSELAQAPKLNISGATYDFGTVNEGQKVEHDFVIRNNGKQPLNIRKTKANCGCTVPELPKMTLAPGEQSVIKVVFNSKGRKGNQYKTVTIFSNDPANPTQVVTLKGKVNG
ncbi:MULTISPECIES: DUF1573 domain-containing protein [Persicobacter]|uniref:DUF1573 domain-containing protein n=1 Tax=Persicobacter diffluens TaxID=981 RepID=A0AAN5AKA2_9BACT|nr:DUF1573 domain-containing protein [Persicobacter sp. CCB-QB2]GJM60236.1 hypothetical protein PEDI_07880 [Persicobacter diffluens]